MPVTGYTAGAFDLLHIGCLRHLESARPHCDGLIASLTTGELSPSYKRKDALGPPTRA
jgi:glycerol-3-phosphate cytidylyltransferase-like family protein